MDPVLSSTSAISILEVMTGTDAVAATGSVPTPKSFPKLLLIDPVTLTLKAGGEPAVYTAVTLAPEKLSSASIAASSLLASTWMSAAGSFRDLNARARPM
jgi:hypothetical protein